MSRTARNATSTSFALFTVKGFVLSGLQCSGAQHLSCAVKLTRTHVGSAHVGRHSTNLRSASHRKSHFSVSLAQEHTRKVSRFSSNPARLSRSWAGGGSVGTPLVPPHGDALKALSRRAVPQTHIASRCCRITTPLLDMSASADVESQSAARPRGRCLDTFLVASVSALCVMFLAGLGGALLFARHVERLMDARGGGGPVGHALSGSSYQGHNFAYLRATNSELKNATMMWEPIEYGDGQSVGALYDYNNQQRVLKVAAGGSYFLYVQLNFSCLHVCPAARFTVKFKDQNANTRLTCSVSLPGGTQPVSRTCWSVLTLWEKDSRLLAGSEFTEFSEPFQNWKLELNDSGFGMFRVDA